MEKSGRLQEMLLQVPVNTTGYGYTGYHIAKRTPCSLYPIGQPDPDLIKDLESKLWINKEYKSNSPEIKIWHQHEMTQWITKGHRCGFPIFELTHFTQQEKASLSHCDTIFVTSQWGKSIIEQNKINTHTEIVPLGVDREIFNENNNLTRAETVFFNAGKWEIRKGHDVLIECFNRAFSQKDNVTLWLMCSNPFLPNNGEEWVKRAKSSPLGHKIQIIPRQPDQKSVYNIMRQVDCGVFPARAEGWNLELLELLSCGKNVITTNYSAHSQFCTPANSLLIEIDELEPAVDKIWFHGQGLWAKIGESEKEHIIEDMRQVHKVKQSVGFSLNIQGVETAKKLTWDNTAQKILSFI